MKKITIKTKYFIAFISIIVLPIMVVGGLVYKGYSNTLLNSTSYKSGEVMNSISSQIEEQTKDIQLILSTLVRDRVNIINENKQLCELITLWNETNSVRSRYELSKVIDNELYDIFSYINGIGNIVFYLENGGFYFYRGYPDNDEILTRQEDWYKEVILNPGATKIIDSTENLVDKTDKNTYISAAISPIKGSYKNNIELIYINLKTNLFDNIYSYSDNSIKGNTIILDSHDNVIFSENKEQLGINQSEIYNIDKKQITKSGTNKTLINGENAMLYTKIVSKTGWKIVNIINYKDLMQSINHINKIAFILIIVILIMFTIFSVYFLSGIIIPIQSLITEMRKIRYGDLDVVVDVKKDGEIGELADTFNIMVKDIKKLIKENNEKERMRSEAEMEALQAQINPHFISNTLSSIRFMAIIAKMTNIREMTEAFINIVSASFNRNSKFTSIEKEIEMLKSYAHIMKVRHGNKYDIIFEAEEEVKDYLILKMLVQPILENAILHGVSGLDYKGCITISFKIIEDSFVVEIYDNGVGISKEMIDKLLLIDCRNDKGFTSIGVKNVDKRVKLNFGQKYGLYIESAVLEYTKVKLIIPIIKDEMEEFSNV